MKILLVADIESKYYWDFFEKSKLEGIDLIISCGDLAPQYLSFLATYAKCPVLYVHGNHDACYEDTPPDGCICIDDDVFVYQGVRIVGLGGSMCYNFGTYQYTEKQMERRMNKLWFKIQRYRGIDIFVAHSPMRGYGDGDDLPHRGFECFNRFIDYYQPKYFFHGHVHISYGRQYKRKYEYNNTTVVNGFERYIIEI